MEILIKSGEDLYSRFYRVVLDINRLRACETLAKGAHVGVKVRKEVLTSAKQGKIYDVDFQK